MGNILPIISIINKLASYHITVCVNAKNYLGNTRVSFKPTAARNEIMQEDHYYPFGMKMAGLSLVTGSPETKFTYNGKELEDDFNLNWYHYGARYYDPQLGRWQQVDPVDEFHSPYLYCSNNPINKIDPDGMIEKDASNINTNDIVGYVQDSYRNRNEVHNPADSCPLTLWFKAHMQTEQIDAIVEANKNSDIDALKKEHSRNANMTKIASEVYQVDAKTKVTVAQSIYNTTGGSASSSTATSLNSMGNVHWLAKPLVWFVNLIADNWWAGDTMTTDVEGE